MRRTVDRPNALKAGTAPGVLEMLQSSNTSLEKIHKCLEVSVRVSKALLEIFGQKLCRKYLTGILAKMFACLFRVFWCMYRTDCEHVYSCNAVSIRNSNGNQFKFYYPPGKTGSSKTL